MFISHAVYKSHPVIRKGIQSLTLHLSLPSCSTGIGTGLASQLALKDPALSVVPGVGDSDVDVVDEVEVKLGVLGNDLILEGLDLSRLLEEDHLAVVAAVDADA